MLDRYEVLCRELSGHYWRCRGVFTNKKEAVRFARRWLSRGYIGESEAIVYRRGSLLLTPDNIICETVPPPQIIARYHLDKFEFVLADFEEVT